MSARVMTYFMFWHKGPRQKTLLLEWGTKGPDSHYYTVTALAQRARTEYLINCLGTKSMTDLMFWHRAKTKYLLLEQGTTGPASHCYTVTALAQRAQTKYLSDCLGTNKTMKDLMFWHKGPRQKTCYWSRARMALTHIATW